jgi:D-sedoheptulose 7-phosphate isomerase
MMEQIKSLIAESIATKQKVLEDENILEKIKDTANAIVNAFEGGFRIYFCGNGGSAADAQHLAAEFTGPFYNRGRKALPAEALHCNTSYLTAAANDYDYTEVYARLVTGIMQKGDILIGLSTSGNSPNVVKAFAAAKTIGVTTVGMTGESGGKMKELSDILFNMPSQNTPRIQEAHMLIGHIICQLVEESIFPKV